ncbi:MAG: carboxypeptidase-like regulatory domain-containing protein [Thermodesulfobacteriota bacterium]
MSANDGSIIRRCLLPWLLLAAVVLALPPAAGDALALAGGAIGRVEGRLLDNAGLPVSDAGLLFFRVDRGVPPSPAGYWRVPDIADRTGADGGFSLRLPAGSYTYGAVRFRDERQGHPLPEDWILLGVEANGELAELFVVAGETLSLGEIVAPAKLEAGEKNPLPAVRLSGRITARGGGPVSEVVVELRQADEGDTVTPLFAADRSGADGWYSVDVVPGRYLLRARPSAPLGQGFRGYRPLPPASLLNAGGKVEEIIEIRTDGVHDLHLDLE